MKAATIFHLAIGLLMIALFSPLQSSFAQNDSSPEPAEKYSREELTQMLAPIALYPDALLSQVLMAATYPIELIEADRWARRNKDLKGEALDAELLNKEWDPSVKALCHFPSILALMSERITETTNLGNAFLAQEPEVMDTVQELRAKAYAQGNLTTTAEQKVTVEKETVIIEPAKPGVIYVPYYDPFYIYGPWWYPAYPPYYWAPPGAYIGVGISYWPGFYFGVAFGTWSYFDWHRHYIFIDVHKRPRFVRHDHWRAKPGRWHHAPIHRRGVAYRDKFTARKYGQYPGRSREIKRDSRGFPEQREWLRSREERTRIERKKQQRERVERESRERQRIDRDKQQRRRIEREQQIRERAEHERRQQARDENIRLQRQKSEQELRQKRIDTIFNRIEEGKRERQSSKRGRFSREGRGGDQRGKGRSGDDDRNDRDNRGRNRR